MSSILPPFLRIFFLGMMVYTVTSCEQNTEEKTATNALGTDSTKNTDTTGFVTGIQKVANELPSPVDFVAYIDQAQLGYDVTLPSPTTEASEYFGLSQQTALNLGVYLTDLGYNCLYFKSQKGMDYLKAVKELSDQLKIIDKVSIYLIENFEKNLNNRDSLLNIAREGYYSIDEYLRKSDRKDLALYVLIGSWTEGLYLASSTLRKENSYFENDKYKPVIWRIAGQKNSVDNLINLLGKIESSEINKNLTVKLEELKKAYVPVKVEDMAPNSQELQVVDIAEIQNVEEFNDKIVINTTKKVEATQKDIEKIFEKIQELRKIIVSKK